jgi:mono/diheme cytochrome c family protein
MTTDVRKVIFGTIIGFFMMLGLWLSVVYISACGFTFTCHRAALLVDRTPVPTLIPATLPPAEAPIIVPSVTPMSVNGALVADTVARPSNPGGPGPAIKLKGNLDSGKEIYVANCERCHGVDGAGDIPNPGTDDGTVPALNPIDDTLISSDYETFATNIDLFIEHGSTPPGTIPNLYMPAWGDSSALTPQQIADVIAYTISLNQ